MMAKLPQRPLGPRLLLMAPVLLGLVLASLWVRPNGNLRRVHWSPPAAQAPDFESLQSTLAPVRQIDPAQLELVLAKPVFSPSRRPAPVVTSAVDTTPAADPLAGIRLYGVFSGRNGGGIIAAVEGKVRRVMLNDALGPWRVSALNERDVTLVHQNGETRVLHLPRGALSGGNGVVPNGTAAAPVPPAPTPNAASAVAASVAQREAESRKELEDRMRRVDAARKAMGLPPTKD